MTIRNSFPDVRPALNLDFANTKRLDPRITFTRSSTGTYVDEFGVIKTAASNEARFDHDSDGNSLGLLIEESRTNLLTYSEDFSQFTKLGSSVSTNTTSAPDGTLTADTLTESSTSGVHIVYPSANSTVANPTVSCFVKAAGRDYFNLRFFSSASNYAYVTVSLIDGSITVAPTVVGSTFSSPSAKVDQLANSWFRVSLSVSCSSTSVSLGFDVSNVAIPATRLNGAPSYLGDGTSGIYVWGAQLEAGSFPTSYIPTTSSTATRSADVASMTGTNFSSWYNQSAGSFVLYENNSYSGTFGNSVRFELNQNSSPNTNTLGVSVDFSNGTRLVSRDSGATGTVSVALPNVWTSGGSHKYAYGLEENNFSIVSGTNVITDTSGTFPPNLDSLSIGNLRANTMFNKVAKTTISRFTYYDRRLTDAQLQALTL